ncbi:MAG: hypothetical protein KDA95_00320 [Acidimicrobiales bacterium]|nr:hypothetical protein [Acidimicrobiales bacterium]
MANYSCYGYRKICAQLARADVKIGSDRCRRLVITAGIHTAVGSQTWTWSPGHAAVGVLNLIECPGQSHQSLICIPRARTLPQTVEDLVQPIGPEEWPAWDGCLGNRSSTCRVTAESPHRGAGRVPSGLPRL